MINLLIGRPGAGKSYEAVAFHVLPALKQHRKVITNLPLNIAHFEAVLGPYVHVLLEIRKPRPDNRIPFSTMADYASKWKHPETGVGPLYVIDECHFPLRRGGTKQDVEEWFSMHRHENADVLLITQSYGKVDKNIVEMVQLLYRVSKKTAWGQDTAYIRKVFDGVRGAEMNVETRSYESAYFPFYRSHTKSDSSAEAYASDVKPFWKQWPVIGAVICCTGGLGGLLALSLSGNGLLSQGVQQDEPEQVRTVPADRDFEALQRQFETAKRDNPASPAPAPAPTVAPPGQLSERVLPAGMPYEGLQLVVVGQYGKAGQVGYLFDAYQNGQKVFAVSNSDLLAAGYEVRAINNCAATLVYGSVQWHSTCRVASVKIGSTPVLREQETPVAPQPADSVKAAVLTL